MGTPKMGEDLLYLMKSAGRQELPFMGAMFIDVSSWWLQKYKTRKVKHPDPLRSSS